MEPVQIVLAPRLGAVAVLLIAMAIATGCSDVGGSTSADGSGSTTVAVPDVVSLDGSHAEDALDDAGLTTTFAASTEDADIGEPRSDATGCQVVEQDPEAEEQVDRETDVTLALDCRQADWDSQDGDEWSDFESAFESGVDEGCRHVFNRHFRLFNDDDEFTSLDCASIQSPDPADDPPSEVPEDPTTTGGDLGFDAGCSAMFIYAGTSVLFYGDESESLTDCQSANPHQTTYDGLAASDDECVGSSGGKEFEIESVAGSTGCSEAKRVWLEYLDRAPAEGEGSGAFLDVRNWTCATAKRFEAPRIGSCGSKNGRRIFHVNASD